MKVSLNYRFSVSDSSIYVYIKAKRPLKMNKIARISVHDIRRIDFIKMKITQSVFKMFA